MQNDKKTLKFVDLFAGIGGFRAGLERCNTARQGKDNDQNIANTQEPNKRGTLPLACVWSNEWDKYAASVYKKHFGECDTRDIRTVDAHALPDFDILVGGFPCQAFSIAGHRKGFDDTRGTLFFEIVRILDCKRPRYLLLENVKGLLSHNAGRTFYTIIKTLDELGYDLQWQVLNSKDFGVPQNRERVYIVGHTRGEPRPQVFPFRPNGEKDNRKTGSDVSYMIDASYAKGINTGSQGGRSSFEKMKRQVIVTGMMTGEKWDKFHESSRRVYNPAGIAPTLPTSAGGGHIPKMEGLKIRRLTPIECERLQGFPDNWTKYGANDELISDTQRYKMCGNAVTTNVIYELGKRIWLNQ